MSASRARKPTATTTSVTAVPLREHYTHIAVPPVITIIGVTAILYLGRDVLLPLAIALLLTFALAPIVAALRRRAVPKTLAIIVTVAMAFAITAMLTFIVAVQVNTLAQNVSTYQFNIIEKIRSLKEIGASGSIVERITGVVDRVGAELRRSTPEPGAAPTENSPKPLPVEIVADQTPLEILQNIVVPLVSPFATAGLVVVVVIFMLLERETLRDKFIRLAGGSDLHRTTEALQDAGKRVGQYLLMQLVINITYAIPITVGLWLLGIPNALLWGLLALVLRFVPYIGPAIGMLLPMLVTLAVSPGWAPLLWTAALFIVMELISNNILEPWLYGSRTGLSSLAIIVSAIFWGWLWGPLGLVLSTPLTVCLVVLGRHVPQFQFLDVLLGNEPVLEPHARIYQRLLAGDPDEAVDYAENYLEEGYLVDFYDKVGIPALALAEQDRQRGVMSDERRSLFAASASALVSELEEIANDEEEESESENQEPRLDEAGEPTAELPDGEGRSLLCLGGRGELDDAAALMLAQVLEVQGAKVQRASWSMLNSGSVRQLPLRGVGTVIISFLNPMSSVQARYAVRRLKRMDAKLRVGLFMPLGAYMERTGEPVSAEHVNADFITYDVPQTVMMGFADESAVKLKTSHKRLSPTRRASVKPRRSANSANAQE
jgi:predicted PurR-regulated permease PerM